MGAVKVDDNAQALSELLTQIKDILMDHRSLLDNLPTVRHPLNTARNEAEIMYKRVMSKGE